MFKNIQFKIILVFFLVGILIISGLGLFFITSVNEVNTQIENGQATNIEQISNTLNAVSTNTKTSLVIAAVAFAVVGVLIAMFLSARSLRLRPLLR